MLRILLICLILIASNASARNYVSIVGSSTMFPFVTMITEEYSKKYKVLAPVVESTGTGHGFKIFCLGNDTKFPDIVNASRPMQEVEKKFCHDNDVNGILEIKLGYDGIVIANSIKGSEFNFSKYELFLALSQHLSKEDKIIANPYTQWSQINPIFPNNKIEIYSSLRNSGTYDAITNSIFIDSCIRQKAFQHAYGENIYKACKIIRTDGRFIEAEHESTIIQKIIKDTNIFGIFGYNFLIKNQNKIRGNKVEGKYPTYENIRNTSYPLSRPLYMYIKTSNIKKINGLKEFLEEVVSNESIGEYGYLVSFRGLVALSEQELQDVQSRVEKVLHEN